MSLKKEHAFKGKMFDVDLTIDGTLLNLGEMKSTD